MNKFLKQYIPWFSAMVLGIIAGAFWFNQNSPTPTLSLASDSLEFTLNSAAGPVTFSDSQGKLRVIYVGYMSCPDVCPTSLSRIAGALYLLSDAELNQLKPFFMSVDTDRDTPEYLAQYSNYFHPAITGITGEKAEVDRVVEYLQAFYRIVPLNGSELGYAIDHSANIYLLDQSGKLVETFPDTLSPEEISARFSHYLN